jgi:hypothetical protein
MLGCNMIKLNAKILHGIWTRLWYLFYSNDESFAFVDLGSLLSNLHYHQGICYIREGYEAEGAVIAGKSCDINLQFSSWIRSLFAVRWVEVGKC